MKKLLFTVLLGLSLLGCKDKNQEKLVVGTSADYPPFSFFKNGEITGFEVELIRAIAQELGKEAVLKDMSFDSIIGALQAKRIDLAISAISVTPERQKRADFTISYHHSMSVLLVSRNAEISAPNDLSGKTLGVQMGTTHEMLAKSDWQPTVPNLSLRSLSKIPELIQDFRSGRLSAILLGVSEAEGIMKTHPDFKVVRLPGTESEFAIALPIASPLTEEINKIITKWQQDGTLQKLEQKWLQGNS